MLTSFVSSNYSLSKSRNYHLGSYHLATLDFRQDSTNISYWFHGPVTFHLDFWNHFEEVEGALERMGFRSARPGVQGWKSGLTRLKPAVFI